MKYTGERFMPEFDHIEIAAEHFHRYEMIARQLKDKIVLDAGCGSGYGSFAMSQHARHVTGIDISQETIDFCKGKYGFQKNLEYRQGSLAKLPIDDHSVDIVVNVEVIEHVEKSVQKAFLHEVKRVLKPDGILIISTPNKLVYTDKSQYHNPYHISEFYYDEFESYLKKKFSYVRMFGQSLYAASVIEVKGLSDQRLELLSHDNVDPTEKYMIAICSNQSDRVETIDLCSLYRYDNFNEYECASLYFSQKGQPFNEKDKLLTAMNVNQNNRFYVEIAIPEDIHAEQIRFDPVEEKFCICSIEKIDTDGTVSSFSPANALEYYQNGFLFLNVDPQFQISGDFTNATYLRIEGYYQELSCTEVAVRIQSMYQRMMALEAKCKDLAEAEKAAENDQPAE